VRRSSYSTEFGRAVSAELAASGMHQKDLAASAGVSVPHLSNLLTGKIAASPHWVDVISSTLKLQEEKRRALHRAAAKTAGYDIDLTKP
jgi:transcriptional regulator with XRE-family HTH domain